MFETAKQRSYFTPMLPKRICMNWDQTNEQEIYRCIANMRDQTIMFCFV